MIKFIYISLFTLILFTGCSTRQYYEPEDTTNFATKINDLNSNIIDLNTDGATLENFDYISKKGILKNLKPNFKFLNLQEDTIIATDDNATIYIKNESLFF